MHAIDYADLSRIASELDAEKPYVELIDGIEVPKVSPKTRHGRLQLEIGVLLRAWAGIRGVVGTEWRFWLVPTGSRRTSLVPDVAYVSNERLELLSEDAYEMPPFAPDVAVEIRSSNDRLRNINRKIALYLEHGAKLVLDVDLLTRSICAHDATSIRRFDDGETFEHPAVAGLGFELRRLFDSAEFRKR